MSVMEYITLLGAFFVLLLVIAWFIREWRGA